MEYLMISITVIVILISIALFLWNRSRTIRKHIALLGANGSGKTYLFMQLVYSRIADTYTSITVNRSELALNKKVYQILDIPGNKKVRSRYFDRYKNQLTAIVFLINSNTLQDEILDVVEYMWQVFKDPVIYKNRPKTAIIFNHYENTSSSLETKNLQKMLLNELFNSTRINSKNLESLETARKTAVSFKNAHIFLNYYGIRFLNIFTKPENDMEANIIELKDWLLKSF